MFARDLQPGFFSISGDRVQSLLGVLNGTCNYILTEMERRGDSLDTVLAEAQKLGYAEADPTADIDGFDARAKLALLAALAFGCEIAPEEIPTEGIRRIPVVDSHRRLCGVFTVDDALQAVAECTSAVAAVSRTQLPEASAPEGP